MILTGSVIFNIFLLTDYYMDPAVFWVALKLRLTTITPCLIIAAIMVYRKTIQWIVDLMFVASMAVASLIIAAVIAISDTNASDAYRSTFIVLLIFAAMVVRVRFRCAVYGSIFLFAGFLFTFSGTYRDMMFRDATYCFVYMIASAFLLYGSYMLERETRLNFLFSRLQALKNAELKTVSLLDALTGLNNRRSLDEELLRLETLAASDVSQSYDLGVLVLDIDHFKQFNDKFGHQAGDQCLIAVSAVLRRTLRAGQDRAYRYGGEEFIVLLDTNDDHALLLTAERIRLAIMEEAIPHMASSTHRVVTVSIGAARGVLNTVTAKHIIEAADSALYASKANGRNRSSVGKVSSRLSMSLSPRQTAL
ncbi:diguanylate cyclase [Rhizobium sp. CFBP 8762]|uniref:GGDEF domain-containing protein n=1 Tax=Rhizobium sp. CFBP 8762 TaxID=2775279 RepID=UPI001783264C|nr:diguanylate cyclase [Rhizobium sp. CFBP 8762]MBD8553795.1 diguanylate cyclase [Rhizobium sp. CFBP 8762]